MSEDEFEKELRENLSKEIKENFGDDVTEDFSDKDKEGVAESADSKEPKNALQKFFGNNDENYDLIKDISADEYEPPKNANVGRAKLIITIIASAAIAVIIIILVLVNSTYNAIYAQGVSAFESENYEKALDCFKKAQSREEGKENTDISRYIADCYIKLGRQDEAIETYNEALQLNPNNAGAVIGLCEIYFSKKDADSINELLKKYQGTDVENSLSEFIVPSPKMDPDGGNFDTVTTVSITGEPDCPIFYTLDGSEPDTSSEVYTKPIPLEEGVTVVKAISVDKIGVKSYVNSKEFILESLRPTDPVFSLDSGVYINGQKLTITAQENARIYYTYNGQTPTRSSYRYYNPITLYTGTFTISSVVYDNDGNVSNVVERDYAIVSSDRQIEQGEENLKRYQERMNKSRSESESESESESVSTSTEADADEND